MSSTTSTNLPDFEDEAWMAETERLENALNNAAVALLQFTRASGFQMYVTIDDARVGTLTLSVDSPIAYRTN